MLKGVLRRPPDTDLSLNALFDVLGSERRRLTLNALFDVLGSERRRLTVDVLAEYDVGATVGLSEISERVAARQLGKPVDDVTSDEYKRVYVGLYQCHADKLHKYAIVERVEDSALEVRERAHEIADVLGHFEAVTGGASA